MAEKSGARVTMKDVAVAAGVSQSTVSFVLTGAVDMRISRETRKRVLAAVEALGYRPRGAGRPPKQAGAGTIGMLFDEIATSPFAAISIEGAQEEAWKRGHVLEVAMTGGDARYEEAVLRKWAGDGVVGVIYGAILTRGVTPPDGLGRHRAVLLNCYDEAGALISVVPAERRGGELATAALIEAGHRRIAFVSGEPWMEASDQRMEGYERALRAARIPVDPSLIVEGNFLPSGGRAATLRLMERERPDAIFCANDLMAVGCYEALKELGERPGETVAIMGYDDQEIAQHLSPPLSTVLLPHREMGQWCVERLLSVDAAPVAERMACPLVLRQSHKLRGIR
ncbi:LacI family DNA-binding transcriptional regulator [Jannaschia seohaensis]|uniref:LacI family transcriptional regulator n=1 Tax=Jannaschia seohaensis TaxID=475081 RepID=A0A2Y9BY52_9RHOB|nr:LacI family DNA-binding transcriptional regulator [Jannaschia seohaensis]PWJ21406.1 LacI family transcriptional regulator [Jannaschia seohaensis]SSA42012.1 LacI family transcriptional regulator [Jannaschia seohaensis]